MRNTLDTDLNVGMLQVFGDGKEYLMSVWTVVCRWYGLHCL